MSEIWKELLRLAVKFLDTSNIPVDRWSLGGGTVLMLYFKHRMSKDIDIFFSDSQFITLLTPRLNDFVAQHVSDYDEQSNFLKLRLVDGEIDFIVAPNLTGLEPLPMEIDGLLLKSDQPEEVIIKKLFYRAETLKVRDIFDLAAVIKHRENSLRKYTPICSGKFWILKKRIEILKRDYDDALKALDILDARLAAEAMGIVEDFLNSLKGDLSL